MSPEPESLTDQVLSSPHPATPPKRSVEGGLLVTLGWMSLLGGAALSILPLVSWRAGKVMNGLAGLGIHGGTIVMGGLGLMAVGMVRRSIDRLRQESTRDDALIVEQMALDVVQVKSSMAAVEEQNHELHAQLGLLRSEVTALRQTPLAPKAESPMSSDALFQLASSLDKLGLRIDQRLKLHHTTLQESIDELHATVEHSRRNMEDRLPPYAPTPDAQSALDVAPQESYPQQPEPPAGPSLGLLDSLDDVPSALPREHAAAIDFDALDARSGELARDLDAAARAPRGSWDEELMVDHSASRQETEHKLEQLQSLLSDERLRAALDQMRRA